MDILDMLDEEADRLQFETMLPDQKEINGLEKLQNNTILSRAMETKLDSEMVIVNVPNGSEDDYNDEEYESYESIVDSLTSLRESVEAIDLKVDLSEIQIDLSAVDETNKLLEKVYFVLNEQWEEDKRRRLLDVERRLSNDNQQNQDADFPVETSNVVSTDNTNNDQSSDSYFPDFGGEGNDKDKGKDKNKSGNKADKKGGKGSKFKNFFKKGFGKKAGLLTLGAAALGGGYLAHQSLSEDDETMQPKPTNPSNNETMDLNVETENSVARNPQENLESEYDPTFNPMVSAAAVMALASHTPTPSLNLSDVDLTPVQDKFSNTVGNIKDRFNNAKEKVFSKNNIPEVKPKSMFSAPTRPTVSTALALPPPKIANSLDVIPDRMGGGNIIDVTPEKVTVSDQTLTDKVKKIKARSVAKSIGNVAGKVVTKGNAVANLALSASDAYDIYNNDELSEKEKTVQLSGVGGRAAGGIAGGAAGAAIGSVVPVVGTAIGGIAGSLIGAYVGEEAVTELADSLYDWFADDEETEKALKDKVEESVETSTAKQVKKIENEPDNYVEAVAKTDAEKRTAKNKEAMEKLRQRGREMRERYENASPKVETSNVQAIKLPSASETAARAKSESLRDTSYNQKLKKALKRYGEANNISKRKIDRVMSNFESNITKRSATIVARDVLQDPSFDPDNLIKNFSTSNTMPKAKQSDIATSYNSDLYSNLVTGKTPNSSPNVSTSVPTSLDSDKKEIRENYSDVQEIEVVVMLDEAYKVDQNDNPKPKVKEKNVSPQTRVVTKQVQTPISINNVDNLGNSGGINFIGSGLNG